MAASGAGIQECLALGEELRPLVDLYIDHLEKARLREGLKTALAVSSLGNAFLSTCEPWNRLATNPDGAAVHLAAAVGLVRLLAALLAPFVPTVAGLFLHFLGLWPEAGLLSDELLAAVERPHEIVPPGHTLGPRSQPLFRKISPSQVEALRARFAGPQGSGVQAGSAAAGGVPSHIGQSDGAATAVGGG